MFQSRNWRLFLTGVLCGMIFVAVVGTASIWWKSHAERSGADNAIFDNCLMERNGNTVACEALMRSLDRDRAARAASKKEAAELLAGSVSKREVVKRLMDKGFGESQVSDAVGISLQDLRAMLSAEIPLKQDATRLLEAGFSKREVVEYLKDKGFGDSQVADAVEISIQDLRAGKY
jgi:hypothetical protein